jgi:hypothetical protein
LLKNTASRHSLRYFPPRVQPLENGPRGEPAFCHAILPLTRALTSFINPI